MFLESCRVALVSLLSNPTRSALTAIGIAVGTTAVIAVVSIVAGLEGLIQREMNQMGAAHIAIIPADPTARPGDLARPGKLTWEDGLALQRSISQIEHITPEITRRETVSWGDERYTTTVYGVSDSWAEVNSRFAEAGRFFGHLEQARRRKVAVIGHRVVEEIFGGRDPVGQELRVVYSSFIALVPVGRRHVGRRARGRLWTLLQSLHRHDVAEGFAWDPATSSDPRASNFSFSVAGRSFFVLGMHERSSRHTRRAPLATLVFNARTQFDDLCRRGTYDTFKRVIRELDLRLQGSVNTSLSDFGAESEVKQYSGKLHDAAWQCPCAATGHGRENES